MDIRAGVIAAVVLSVIGAILVFRSGYRAWLSARKLTFYRIKRRRQRGGLVTILISLLLLSFGVWLSFFGEPIAYQYFPPSLTPSLVPTITPTPFIPLAIEVLFESEVTPDPNAVFSPLQFTLDCSNFNEFTSATVFQNPTRYVCAVFTYDQMTPNAQWTALWYREGKLVHYETIPWDGEVGGYGFTEWEAPPEEFLPGTYEVQIFVGLEWKVVGQFILQGDAPTAIPTVTLTSTLSPTPTRTSTATPTSTRTNTPPPAQPVTATVTP